MESAVTFRIDMREFNQALKEYLEHTKRAEAYVLNKKALFVARGALRRTPSTQKGAITSSLGQIIRKRNGSEMILPTLGKVHPNRVGKETEAPLAALIINARRARDGRAGLYGAKMTAAIEALIAARNRSRAFLKSGWIPAIRKLQPLVKESYGLSGAAGRAVQIGAPKGNAIPARPGEQCKAIIENAASGDHETNDALIKYGGPALQAAFDAEVASMERFLADELYKEARDVGIKVFAS